MYDTHAHLDLFENSQSVLDDSFKNGINKINTICTKIIDFEKIYAIVNYSSNIYCSIGRHPENIDSDTNCNLEDFIFKKIKEDNNKKIIGIGETGLDYSVNITKEIKIEQKKNLEKHLNIASLTKLPIILHTRNAEDDTFDYINNFKNSICGVAHCYTGTKELMFKLLDFGFYISFSGILTFKNAENIRENLKLCPKDRIIAETDAPFLSPEPMRGKLNYPHYLKYTIKAISNILKEDMENRLWNNSLNAFRISTLNGA